MTHRPILDAGPGLTFFSLNRERLLFSVLGPLNAPETVIEEISRRSAADARFARADHVRRKLPDHLFHVLSDDADEPLQKAVERICGMPWHERRTRSKDLGEVMVLAHAAVAAHGGRDTIILMDDGAGRQMVGQEAQRLNRLRQQGQPVGSISLISTLTVLEGAVGGNYLKDRAELRDLYARMRKLDDGLPPLAETNLLHLPCWSKKKPSDP